MTPRRPLPDRVAAAAMIVGGGLVTALFGGGAVGLLADQLLRLIAGQANLRALMEILLVAPLAGGAPALLGLVMARNGWRRLRPRADAPEADG